MADESRLIPKQLLEDLRSRENQPSSCCRTLGATAEVTDGSLSGLVICLLKDRSLSFWGMVSIVVFWLLSGLTSHLISGLLHTELGDQVLFLCMEEGPSLCEVVRTRCLQVQYSEVPS